MKSSQIKTEKIVKTFWSARNFENRRHKANLDKYLSDWRWDHVGQQKILAKLNALPGNNNILMYVALRVLQRDSSI